MPFSLSLNGISATIGDTMFLSLGLTHGCIRLCSGLSTFSFLLFSMSGCCVSMVDSLEVGVDVGFSSFSFSLSSPLVVGLVVGRGGTLCDPERSLFIPPVFVGYYPHCRLS